VSDLALLAALWMLWCVVHSLLIAPAVTHGLQRRIGSAYRYYRLAYNVVALVSLAAVVWFQMTLPRTVLLPETLLHMPWTLVWLLPLGGAAFFFWSGARAYDLRVFLGFAQLRSLPSSSPGTLQLHGILRRVRHPWYTATILLLLAWFDGTEVTLVTRVVLIVYTIIGAVLEERKLVTEYPETYRRYQRAVPMLVPRLRAAREI
jgi:methanethiol S-methyltransferase